MFLTTIRKKERVTEKQGTKAIGSSSLFQSQFNTTKRIVFSGMLVKDVEVLLSTDTIPTKNLKDPKVETFVYNILFIKSQVTVQQRAPVVRQNHRIKEI